MLYALPLHDPSTGFHDIKAPPLFAPETSFLLSVLVFLTALVLFSFFLWKLRRKQEPEKEKVSPHLLALEQLRSLAGALDFKETELRELAGRLSFTLREYLERGLSIPALEKTIEELQHSLPENLQQRLQLIAPRKLADEHEQLLEILHYCHQREFAPCTESDHESKEQFEDMLRKARESVKTLHRFFERQAALEENQQQPLPAQELERAD